MACTSYFSCNNEATRNLGLEQVIKLLVDVDADGCPILRTASYTGSGSCTPWFDCNDEKKRNLSLDQIIRLLVDVDGNGCPVIRTT